MKMVTHGKNSFIQDSPNLVLSWGGVKQAPVAFQVVAVNHTEDLTQMSLQALNTGKGQNTPITTGKFADMQLFVDDITVGDVFIGIGFGLCAEVTLFSAGSFCYNSVYGD